MMRKVRGIKNLCEYLKSINCEMSVSTINRLLMRNEIPHHRPAPRIIIFDLDEIDNWLSGGDKNAS